MCPIPSRPPPIPPSRPLKVARECKLRTKRIETKIRQEEKHERCQSAKNSTTKHRPDSRYAKKTACLLWVFVNNRFLTWPKWTFGLGGWRAGWLVGWLVCRPASKMDVDGDDDGAGIQVRAHPLCAAPHGTIIIQHRDGNGKNIN